MNKMKRIYPLLVSLLVLPLSAFGQEPEHNTYDNVEITHKRGQWYENGYQVSIRGTITLRPTVTVSMRM